MSRRVSFRVGLAATALVWAAAGCGIPTDSRPRPLDDVPFGLVAAPTTVPADEPTPSGTTTPSTLYFVNGSGNRLVRIETNLPKAASPVDQARVVLQALAGGPSEAQGARSALRPGAQFSVDVQSSVATIGLDQSVVDAISGIEQTLAIGQMVLSLTKISPILGVRFTENGVPLAVPLPDGTFVDDRAVTANDYFPLMR